MLPSQPFIVDRIHSNRRQEFIEVAELARLRRECIADTPARPQLRRRWLAHPLPHWLAGHAKHQRSAVNGGRPAPIAYP